MSMMVLPRYRHQSLDDLQHLVLEPMIRDRIAIAHPGGKDRGELVDVSGMAIWASLSDEAEAKLRGQIRAGVWPVHLAADDWTSGASTSLLMIIVPARKMISQVLAIVDPPMALTR